jgi:hypothetical protein
VTPSPKLLADGFPCGMGHEVRVQKAIAENMSCAEVLKDENSVRAGGNVWAAGINI